MDPAVARYLKEAELAETRAREAATPHIQDQWRRIARSWRELAKLVEQRSRP